MSEPDSPTLTLPSQREIEAGRKLAAELSEHYDVTGPLIRAARAGYITELRCAMPYCFACGPCQFDPHTHPPGPWSPTHEHYPVAKRHGGTRDVTNTVLSHLRCNNIGHKLEEVTELLKTEAADDGGPLCAEAIAAAVKDQVELRRTAHGCWPRGHGGSHERAIRVARQAHATLNP